MIKKVKPGQRTGTVNVPSSKSCAHRVLICSALSQGKSLVYCDGISKDITATVKCLNAMGAEIDLKDDHFNIIPVSSTVGTRHLFCGESGSTLRFLMPLVGCFGFDAVFHMEGLLPTRPHDQLINELKNNGMEIRQENDLLYCSGNLLPGKYSITGSVSSQFISGLLFALPLLKGDSELEVTGKIESADYIAITEKAISDSGILFEKQNNIYSIKGNQKYCMSREITVEKDWSNAAFFLCMGAMSRHGIRVPNMSSDSKQGDKQIIDILKRFGADVDGDIIRKNKLMGIKIDASGIPDLVPTICALASAAEGQTVINNAGRLRFKESDRLKSTANMLRSLGGDVTETDDGLIINGGKKLTSGTVDAQNDHRIAMAAAVAACNCDGEVIISCAQCVDKSYPRFWDDLEKLEVVK